MVLKTSILLILLKICLLVFLLISSVADAQNKDSIRTQIRIDRGKKALINIDKVKHSYDSIPEDIRSVFITRKQTYNFFKTQLELAEPSTVSSKYFMLEITVNSDTSLQKKMFKLNADIQTPIGLGGSRWNFRKLGWMSTIHIIPQFKVRIFENDILKGDSSSPVRTPSYLPRFTYFGTHKSLWKVNPVSHYFGASVFHHSNGQDGNQFNELGEINTYNGNFGEDLNFEFIYGGLYSSKVKSRKLGNKGLHPKPDKMIYYSEDVVHDFYWKASYEWHPKPFTDTAFLAHNLYGRKRLNLQVGYINAPIFITKIFSNKINDWVLNTEPEQKEFFRLILNMNYILDNNYSIGNENYVEKVNFFNCKKRMNLYLTVLWRIRGTPYSAFFLQTGWWGSDNYNIYFQQSLWHFRIGLSFGFFKYPQK